MVAWRERRATENACRGRGYGTARRGSKKAAESVELYCLVLLLLKVSSLVSMESML